MHALRVKQKLTRGLLVEMRGWDVLNIKVNGGADFGYAENLN